MSIRLTCYALAVSLNSRSTVDVALASPAATAGVVLSVMWGRQRLYQQTNNANISFWFSHFLLNALVKRVDRGSACGSSDCVAQGTAGGFDSHFIYNFGDKSFAGDIRKRLGIAGDVGGSVFPKK